MPQPADTRLPADPEPDAALAAGEDPAAVAARHPASSAPWAALADAAWAGERGSERSTTSTITSYAYARVGYHRGLDALRRAGWKGHGPVPWSHEPNRGFLRALAALGRAAAAIGEEPEARRCADFVRDCDPGAPAALGWPPADLGS